MSMGNMKPEDVRKPDKLTAVLKIGIVILVITAIAILAGACFFGDDSNSTSTDTETSVETPKAAPLLSKGSPVITTTEFGNIVVEGIVRNDGNAKAIWVEAEATFYDSSKNILGKYSDYLDELAVGESWRYSIMYLGTADNLVKSASVKVTHQ